MVGDVAKASGGREGVGEALQLVLHNVRGHDSLQGFAVRAEELERVSEAVTAGQRQLQSTTEMGERVFH